MVDLPSKDSPGGRRKYSEDDANDLLKKDEVDGKDLWGLYRASPSSNRLHKENEKKK